MITVFLPQIARPVLTVFLSCNLAAYCQQSRGQLDPNSAPPLSAEQVAKNLEQKNAQRTAALQQFTSRRVYRMQYRGFPGNRDAQMVIDVNYRAPNTKTFKVVSQSGSPFLIDHILKRLMESEQEFSNDKNQKEDALISENYDFTMAGYEVTPSGAQYILNLSPKKKNRFLYRGKIWIDAKDFAVVRIEAEPLQTPSVWIKQTEIEHSYRKVNDFWLPAADRTESKIRLGGEAILSIDYEDYKIIKAAPVPGGQRTLADSK